MAMQLVFRSRWRMGRRIGHRPSNSKYLCWNKTSCLRIHFDCLKDTTNLKCSHLNSSSGGPWVAGDWVASDVGHRPGACPLDLGPNLPGVQADERDVGKSWACVSVPTVSVSFAPPDVSSPTPVGDKLITLVHWQTKKWLLNSTECKRGTDRGFLKNKDDKT